MEPKTGKVHGTYAAAGVHLDIASKAKDIIRERVRHTFRPEVLTDIGPFAGLFKLGGYRSPVLVSSVDGVGTKVKIAIALDKHDTVGIDLVNHCVNDIFTTGAEPLFFLDYIAMGTLIPERIDKIISGLTCACKEVNCAIIGGETAEMPGIYAPNDYDLAGFIVGIVEQERIVPHGSIAAGDAILGFPSNGLHTNGYSLVRKVFNLDHEKKVLNKLYPELGCTLGEKLLEPHRCYYPLMKSLINGNKQMIKGLAHITGGGIPGNVARIIPEGLIARFRTESWTVPPIFTLIEEKGSIERQEMYRVFNMGLGMAVVCSPDTVNEILMQIPEAKIVGEIVGSSGVEERVMLL